MGHEFGDEHVLHVGTDLARRAPSRPDALTLTLAPRVARSLARFENAQNFNKPLNSWNTSSVTDMSYMWVLTSPAVRPPAPTRSRSRPRSLRASLARFAYAKNFNQDLNSWNTSSVTDMSYMWVLTSPAVRPPAPPTRSRSLRASLARLPGSKTPFTSTSPSIAGTRAR